MKTNIKYIALTLIVMLNFSFTQKENAGFQFRQQNNKAFGFGEALTYRVHYGWFKCC